ncbi:MAG: RDD family protein [Halobaculum sp.]
MVGLRLFGAIHADRRGKVASEFARVADGVDAVFVEYPVDGFGFERAFRALARAPLAALGMLLVSVVQWPLYALLVRSPLPAEIVAAREYAADNDLDVHAVDDHPIATLATAGPRVAVPNWLATLGLAAFDPLGSLLAAAAVVGAWLVGSLLVRVHRLLWAAAVPFLTAGFGWVILGSTLVSDVLLAGCVLALLVVVVVTLGDRNEVMIDRVAEQCASADYDAVILTTGRAHLPGLRSAAHDCGVSVEAEYRPRPLVNGTLEESPRVTGDGEPPAGAADGERRADAGDEERPAGVSDETRRAAVRRVADPDTASDVLGRRLLAGLLDTAVVGVLVTVTSIVVAASTAAAAASVSVAEPLGGVSGLLGVLAGLAVGAGYYALPEARWGKTVGKKLFGLVVVDTEGRPISPFAAGFRTFLRLLDLPTLYLLVLVDVWDGRQRFGDRAADTVVARAGSGETDETDRAE